MSLFCHAGAAVFCNIEAARSRLSTNTSDSSHFMTISSTLKHHVSTGYKIAFREEKKDTGTEGIYGAGCTIFA
ncbi:hypothetical protein PAHAL_4G352300 [Panicum hallii]|jgi:hypothetical protein|uniref:Uncharacterized protein n=1 Tax=Panicum hallii TaxID=206008 RepID=A0A2T8JF56_9POAL|nr:hypothetical protein PAHAL_4G352300 [Panicum hallii]